VAVSVSLLADLAPHLRDGTPRLAAAAEPGLVPALARALGRAAGRGPPDSQALLGNDAEMAGNAAAVLEAALEGADGAQRAAEFVHAGGAGHLVRAGPAPLQSRPLPQPLVNGSRSATRPNPHLSNPCLLHTPFPQLALLPLLDGNDVPSCDVASAVRALAQHACGRAALVAADAEAALPAAAASRRGAWAPALAEALETLRRLPEHGPGSLAAGTVPRLCTVCGAPGSRGRPLKQCAGCRGPERWCSAECQRSSWAGHRAVCLERRGAAAAAAAAAAGSE
jgi:hypothetical protein